MSMGAKKHLCSPFLCLLTRTRDEISNQVKNPLPERGFHLPPKKGDFEPFPLTPPFKKGGFRGDFKERGLPG